MPPTTVTVDGLGVSVDVAGPDKGSVVVVLGAAHHAPAAYEAVCQRLHTASLRTIVIAPDPRLTAKSVVAILDALEVKWALLVGDRVGGELAWELAATRLDRFIGLVVIDRGHPRVADLTGTIRDETLPARGDEHHRVGQHSGCARRRQGQPALRLRRLPAGRPAGQAQRPGSPRRSLRPRS